MQRAKSQGENPVYYVQYAHARIASILKKAKSEEFGEGFGEEGGDVSLLVTQGDLSLIRKMLELREIVAKCAADLSPHHLATHSSQTASMAGRYARARAQLER